MDRKKIFNGLNNVWHLLDKWLANDNLYSISDNAYGDVQIAMDNIFDASEFIMNQPDIVRCRDCKFAERDGWDRRICQNVGHPVGDDFFCADGKIKKEDKQDE